MRFGAGCSFITFSRDAKGRRTVRITSSREYLESWHASTRTSPVFRVEDVSCESPAEWEFRGNGTLLLLGPVHPAHVLAHVPEQMRVWLSLGLFNVLLCCNRKKAFAKVENWLETSKVPFEKWTVKNGVIENIEFSTHRPTSKLWRAELSKLAHGNGAPEIKEAVEEYCPLVASTLSRAERLPDQPFQGIEEVSSFVCSELTKFHSTTPTDYRYRALGQLLTLNAGLSRFASQTFAGTSPVFETECHFWSHSALGIGTATLGLWKLRKFLDQSLGNARLPQKFDALREFRTDVPDLCNRDWIEKDYLGASKISPEAEEDPLLPLISYFSARDGYRSTETTVSAPLAAVSSCNSARWSLLTITHEISHVIIRGVMAFLYPDLTDSKRVQSALDLLDPTRGPAPDLLHEIRRVLLQTIIHIDATESKEIGKSVSIDELILPRLLEYWRHEVDETMTHTFDFLYFYGQDVERYIAGIWTSWGTIPNVSTRVRGYVIRTIAAVTAKHSRRGQAEELAKSEVLSALEKLHSADSGGRYVEDAIKYLKEDWDFIRKRVLARKRLVKIVRYFLFSEQIATILRSESEISGGATEREGYNLKRGALDFKEIRNPLRFIELYTTDADPAPATAAWMFYILAFCIQE